MAKRLLTLNGLAILSVALFHAAGWGYTAMFAWTPRYQAVSAPNFDQIGTMPYYALRLVDQLVVFSIPAFLFVSGAFVAFSRNASSRMASDTKSWNRIRLILIPYLLWSILMIALRFVDGTGPGLVEIGRMLLLGQSWDAYYYVPLLIQMVLVAPILLYFLEAYPVPLLIVTGLVTLLPTLVPYGIALHSESAFLNTVNNFMPKWLFLTRLFWFVFGIYLARRIAIWKDLLHDWRWTLLGITLLAFIIGFIEWEWLFRVSNLPWLDHRETVIDSIYSLAVILTTIAFAKARLPATGFLNSMGAKSYGIYLAHIPAMFIVARTLYHLWPQVLGIQPILQAVLIAAGVGIPLGMMKLFRSPTLVRAYPLLFG